MGGVLSSTERKIHKPKREGRYVVVKLFIGFLNTFSAVIALLLILSGIVGGLMYLIELMIPSVAFWLV